MSETNEFEFVVVMRCCSREIPFNHLEIRTHCAKMYFTRDAADVPTKSL